MPGRASRRITSGAVSQRYRNALERGSLTLIAIAVLALPLLVGGGLLFSAREILAAKTMTELFASGRWDPSSGEFAFLPFLIGTLWVTVLAVLLALPLSLGVAVFLTEYAPSRLAAAIKPAIDVMAGLPSVIFGLWGIIVVVPFVRDVAAPLFGAAHSGGYSILAAAIVLALMITPILVQVSAEMFASVPAGLRQAVSALGATRWEVVRHAVLRKARPGLVAAVMLALARAFGETLAVMMVVGGLPKTPAGVSQVPVSPLAPADTLTTLIANGYGELSSIPLYHGAFMGAAFILLVVVAGFTLLSRLVLARVKRGME